jgi:hypothetical protein
MRRALSSVSETWPPGALFHAYAGVLDELALGERFEDDVNFFDKMSMKRNQAVYDTASTHQKAG